MDGGNTENHLISTEETTHSDVRGVVPSASRVVAPSAKCRALRAALEQLGPPGDLAGLHRRGADPSRPALLVEIADTSLCSDLESRRT